MECIYEKFCIFSYVFKFQSPLKYSPFDAMHLSRCYSTAQNSFWTRQFWCLLVLLAFSVHFSHIGKTFPSEDFFFVRETKKESLGARSPVNREGGAWGSCHIWSETAKHWVRCGQVRSSITQQEMGKRVERVFKKKFAEAECSLSQQRQLVHWSRWVPRTLT